jgi:hypothetical protein
VSGDEVTTGVVVVGCLGEVVGEVARARVGSGAIVAIGLAGTTTALLEPGSSSEERTLLKAIMVPTIVATAADM